jgi:hypothetical protein
MGTFSLGQYTNTSFMLTTLKDCTNSVLIKGLVSGQNLKYLDNEGGKPEILGFNEHGDKLSVFSD